MSNKEVIVKYIVDCYIRYKKGANKDRLEKSRDELEDFLIKVCNDYEEFEQILEEYHKDDLDWFHEEFGCYDDGQSLMELEQEEYYSNVIAPQKF